MSAIASAMAAAAPSPPPPSSSSSSPAAPPPPAELVAAATRAGQAHLFADWNELSEAQRARRCSDVAAVDFSALAVALSAALGAEKKEGGASSSSSSTAARNAGCEPWDRVVSLEGDANAEQIALWEAKGLETAAAGELAVVVLAGGQGTRLGSSKPKGCFDIGLPCGTSLFGLLAGRVLNLRRRAGAAKGAKGGSGPLARVDLYVMTSAATHDETVAHFEASGHFGLGREGVFFFRQGTMPCVTEEGKVILGPRLRRAAKEARGEASEQEQEQEQGEEQEQEQGEEDEGGGIAASPDGNGGLYAALVASGALDRMERRGARVVDVVCVDNALASPGDPAFVGACVSAGASVGCRAVARSRPEEKVGVLARDPAGGRLRVLEYSELDPRRAAAVDERTGRPLFAWANVCMHFFSTRFLRAAAADLGCGPGGRALYHCARKPIPSFSAAENADVSVPGIKLELFIFDAFDAAPEAEVLVCGVARRDAFAPVKNADAADRSVVAADTPAAARAALLARRARVGEERGF